MKPPTPDLSQLHLQGKTASEIHDFLQGMFAPKLPALFYPHLIATTILIGLKVLAGVFVVGERIFTRSFWLFRVSPPPAVSSTTRMRWLDGARRLVVPNSLVAFVICAPFFSVTYLAWCWCFYARSQGWIPPSALIPLFYVLQILFAPLIIAVLACAVGLCASAFSVNNTAMTGMRKTEMKLLDAALLNAILVVPIIFVLVAFLPISVISGLYMSQAWHAYAPWSATVLSLPPDSVLPQALRNEGVRIWQMWATSCWWSFRVGFGMWTAADGMFLLLWGIIASYMIHMVAKRVRMHEDMHSIAAEEVKTDSGARFQWMTRRSDKSRSSRKSHTLRPALNSLIALAISVFCGAFAFLVAAIFWLVPVYKAVLVSPDDFFDWFGKLSVVMLWIVAIFCSSIFVTICASTLRPHLTALATRDRSSSKGNSGPSQLDGKSDSQLLKRGTREMGSEPSNTSLLKQVDSGSGTETSSTRDGVLLTAKQWTGAEARHGVSRKGVSKDDEWYLRSEVEGPEGEEDLQDSTSDSAVRGEVEKSSSIEALTKRLPVGFGTRAGIIARTQDVQIPPAPRSPGWDEDTTYHSASGHVERNSQSSPSSSSTGHTSIARASMATARAPTNGGSSSTIDQEIASSRRSESRRSDQGPGESLASINTFGIRPGR